MGLGTQPFQAPNSAVNQYEALFARYLPTSTRKQAALGLNSFSAWLLFAEKAKACGGDLTPKCVYDAASKVTTWNGGGLQAPANPSQPDKASPCFAIVKPSSTAWTVVTWPPETNGFNCSTANVVPLTGNYGTGHQAQRRGQEHVRPALTPPPDRLGRRSAPLHLARPASRSPPVSGDESEPSCPVPSIEPLPCGAWPTPTSTCW